MSKPISEGIGPVRRLYCTSKLESNEQSEQSVGLKAAKRPSSVGRVPVMKLLSIDLPKTRHPVASCSAHGRRRRTHDEQGDKRAHNSVSDLSMPSSVGMVPVR